jgi:HTH-type transcriptional regulator / antitoxin MqsA
MARKCINCVSRKKTFRGPDLTIEHAARKIEVEGLSGWRCDACGEVEFDADSARRYAAAGDELILRELAQRIRRKLGLSQVAGARLTGGGHNAFSRYERGEATPMPAVINLFRLLDRHPAEGSRQVQQRIEKEASPVISKEHCGAARSHPFPESRCNSLRRGVCT